MDEQIEHLLAWLADPVYETGVALYERYILHSAAGSSFLYRMLETGADDYNRQRLGAAIEQTCQALVAERDARQATYPPPLTDALENAKLLMDERTILKERLRVSFSQGNLGDENTKAWSFRILAITGELDRIYGRQQFFDRHGYLPDVAEVDAPETPADLVRRQHSVRTYVTKYTKQYNQAVAEEDRNRLFDKLKRYQSELEDLNTRISELIKHDVPV